MRIDRKRRSPQRVAVCFTGQIRTFERAKHAIQTQLLNNLQKIFSNVDTIAIQNSGDEKFDGVSQWFNYTDLAIMKDYYKQRFLHKINISVAKACYQYFSYYGFYGSLLHVLEMWRDVSRCRKTILDVEKANGVKYDILVRWRYDYSPTAVKLELIKDWDSTIYTSEKHVGVQDSFAIGPRKFMMDYFSYPIE